MTTQTPAGATHRDGSPVPADGRSTGGRQQPEELVPVAPTEKGGVGLGSPGPTPSALAGALAAVQLELPRIKKDQTAKVTGETKQGKPVSYSYSYADLTDVSAAVLPLLAKHGLSFTAFPTLTAEGKFVLRYHLLHKAGERESGEYPLPSSGTAQAMGSAITYARRYCLCAVTGVSPDDDDDAAAAVAGQAAEREQQQAPPPLPQELVDARDAVRGAWMHQFGSFNQAEAAELFGKWSGGEILTEASAARLKSFAGYLTTLPAVDAGADPSTTSPTGDEVAEGTEPPKPKDMTGLQRGRIFASLTELGITERSAQLEWFSRVVGRILKSRSELTFDDAKVVIDELERIKTGAGAGASATPAPASPDQEEY
jgi:hypothetical protein